MAPDGPATPDHGPAPASSHTLGRRLFCHGLGAVHLAASLSLLFQVRGLMGAGGIHPAAQFLHHAKTQLGPEAFWKIPSLCWFWHSDTALASLCLIQALAGSLLLLGRLPGPAALTGWTALLSLCSVGSPFLDFQWDALLLETTLLATFLLPWQLRPNWASESGIQRISLWLLWWLLFRLMLLSGIVKLSSGDPAWRGLSALCHHFETQPLPLWTAFHLHKLPAPVLQAATLAMFIRFRHSPVQGPCRPNHRCPPDSHPVDRKLRLLQLADPHPLPPPSARPLLGPVFPCSCQPENHTHPIPPHTARRFLCICTVCNADHRPPDSRKDSSKIHPDAPGALPLPTRRPTPEFQQLRPLCRHDHPPPRNPRRRQQRRTNLAGIPI